MDLKAFIKGFQDHLAPKLDTYEQAIYLYVFRHSRFEGKNDIVIGFKSARSRMAFGIGQDGSAMSENQSRKKLRSLQSKGCLQVLGVERAGTRIRLNLPSEIPGIIARSDAAKIATLDEMDFFSEPALRELIIKREGSRCFYCLKTLEPDTYVIEHVTSRPSGDNSYRNLVAACITCNNRKGPLCQHD